jgi:hypothetical protein
MPPLPEWRRYSICIFRTSAMKKMIIAMTPTVGNGVIARLVIRAALGG